jgi:hypothetical protein
MELANAMHNMLCIGIDFGWALHLDSMAVCNGPAAPAPTRMRFKGFWSLAKAFGDHLFFAHGFLLREDYFWFPVMHFGGESVL